MLSRIVNDTSRVVKMMIIGEATTWSITYSEDSQQLFSRFTPFQQYKSIQRHRL
jgi:hypothetical protein